MVLLAIIHANTCKKKKQCMDMMHYARVFLKCTYLLLTLLSSLGGGTVCSRCAHTSLPRHSHKRLPHTNNPFSFSLMIKGVAFLSVGLHRTPGAPAK